MSFTSMHNDYLDPDYHSNSEDYGFNEILDALQKRSTNRWQWDKIHCCLTGKDADLEPHGQQGIELVGVDEDHAHIVVHAYKTFAGTDVCLNMPRAIEDDRTKYCEVREIWMDMAESIVCGCGSAGEWDGDSWGMTLSESVKCPVELTEEGEIDLDKTVSGIVSIAEKALTPWKGEIALADEMLSEAAGWKQNGKRMKEGKPGKCSAYAIWKGNGK